jgi:CelD/BcsL family acetyltransferase involved in cellulose biosynthesis
MQFNLIQQLPEMKALALEWNALLENSAIHVPFLRHEYLLSWWKNMGGGEWDQGELNVITARNASGLLVGIAPLFLTHNREGERALMFLGSIDISDYLDIIVSPDDLSDFIDGFCDFIASPRQPAWQVLDFYNLLDFSPILPALKQAAETRGWLYIVETLQNSPYIPLKGDWETYLAGLDKKQRHEIRRKIRRAEQNTPPSNWYFVEDENVLDEEMEALFRLMSFDPKKKTFLTQAMKEQMLASAHAAFQAGWLKLAFIETGGEKAAAYLNFDYQNKIWVYNSGLDPRFRDLSPGWVLLSWLIRWSIDNNRDTFDFLRGEEDYKYRFGAVDNKILRARVAC